ncbi:hypothetical protein CAPTEDRAFT_19146 [Capitella teleta]|uniref:PRA1 family protein n=1 Tax=Capitella teleta TaxID=283909 RepID=R7UTK9_CAPTE|nr:hypothetical protein CAPTEDRAFT_19146 [Capitella teleta]|eukprot:ELU09515.1 hypothetical protein CAPTEDRAFT_19146 [Capitella teleta]
MSSGSNIKNSSSDLSGDIDPPSSDAEKSSMMSSVSLSNMQMRDWLMKRRESIQPWAEFLKTSKFKLPKAVAPATKRIVANIERFQSNYIFVFLLLFIFCILTSPMLLIALAAIFGACYIVSLKNADKKFSLMGHELSLAQQYASVGLMSIPVLWLAGAGSAIFWIIGASVFVIMLHASMYSLDDEVAPFDLDMEEV